MTSNGATLRLRSVTGLMPTRLASGTDTLDSFRGRQRVAQARRGEVLVAGQVAPHRGPPGAADHLRAPAASRGGPDPRRLLPTTRQEAQAVPDPAARRGEDRRRHGDQ